MARKRSNEWEFQGQVLNWLNEEITRRQGLGLERATQEPSKTTPKRSDLVIWRSRAADEAFLEIELKQPKVSITNLDFFRDAEEKAKRWGAAYFAIWNMAAAELYKTPEGNTRATPSDRIHTWPVLKEITSVDDWLNHDKQELLKKQALLILDKAWEHNQRADGVVLPIDTSVFVERLSTLIPRLKINLHLTLVSKSKGDRTLRQRIKQIAAEQGFAGFVDDVEAAIAGQYAYRIVGQVLFYFALRRRLPALPELELKPSDSAPSCFKPFWDRARRYDYEAIFAPSELDEIIPISAAAQDNIRTLVTSLHHYDWATVRDDVLGSIFERLIPKQEQILLGQFYTPALVADLLVAFSLNGSGSAILDPSCGSGTFLMRSYSYLKWISGVSHSQLLRQIWGFDISPFATELSVINLFRQDFSEFDNFPRIVCKSFFELKPNDLIPFPPAQGGGTGNKILEPIPRFDSIVGNPPYLRSQNQDDLPRQSKDALFNAAAMNGIVAPSKTDLFAFFIYKALEFLKPSGRLGFVVSASWMTSESGLAVHETLLEHFRPIAFIISDVEAFFAHAEINTVLIVAERMPAGQRPPKDSQVFFVRLKRPLMNIFGETLDNWKVVQDIVDRIESSTDSWQDDNVRVHVEQISSITSAIGNWLKFLRAPLSYFKIFGDE
jgi:type I restriction-modification system DNA methylase subunit